MSAPDDEPRWLAAEELPYHGGGVMGHRRSELCVKDAVRAAAGAVADELGPGWPEAVYQRAMETELRARGLAFEVQRALPIRYRGYVVGYCLADLVVWDDPASPRSLLVVDLKAVDHLKVGDEVQVMRYVRELADQEPGARVTGLLVNFAQVGHKRKLIEGAWDGDLQTWLVPHPPGRPSERARGVARRRFWDDPDPDPDPDPGD